MSLVGSRMPKNLNSVDSRLARKKRRGESDEAYAQRIRRLDAKRESRSKRKASLVAAPVAPSAFDQESSKQILQRFLDERDREREETAAQVALLVKKLEQSEFERRRLEAELMRAASVLSTRNLVGVNPVTFERLNAEDNVEIVCLSGNTSSIGPSHEIIEDSGDTDEVTFDGDRITDKHTESQYVSAISDLHVGDPAFITPSGYKGGAGRPWDLSLAEEGQKVEGDEKGYEKKFSITLADASEMLLWVGWVDRARQEHPHRLLVVRFGEAERRAWSDVVAVAAEFVGGCRLDSPAEEIPFAFELTWTLRYALDSLPAGALISDVAARCATSFMKPQPRNRLGVLGGCETTSQIKKKFEIVLGEIEANRLIIDRGEP